MTSSAGSSGRGRKRVSDLRAVIDIGSNTVRMVIYSGAPRAPVVMWNEKVAAKLGRDLSVSGKIPKPAWDEALGALARYAMILADLGVEDVQTVATAAAREASNGAAFLAEVEKLGLAPKLLSGEEEALASASGAMGAFPNARGIVADLGGGSLELVEVAQQETKRAASVPLGTLRLPALREKADFEGTASSVLIQAGFGEGAERASGQNGALYLVGGTWRALAAFAMHELDYPLTDPHGFELSVDQAKAFASQLMQSDPSDLQNIRGISPMRAGYLPDAAALLDVLLTSLNPSGLVFSSWGIREGLLYAGLSDLEAVKDPLLAGIDAFAAPRRSSITDAASLAAWSVEIADGDGSRNERLRLSAAQLSVALHKVEPNLRADHAVQWAHDKRWIGLSARGRVMIAAALLGSLGRTNLPSDFHRLASDEELREGVTWGLGFRLGHRLGAASRVSMLTSALIRGQAELTLRLDESRAALAHYPVTRDLEVLAEWLGLAPRIAIGQTDQ